jgi:hypothetical protein
MSQQPKSFLPSGAPDRRFFVLRAASVVFAALTLAACGGESSPVAPTPAARPLLATTGSGEKTKVKGVKRNTAIATATTVRATIGFWGGTINAPGGLTVVVPPGAVLAPTNFAVTTVPGKLVAYEFEPHGQRFLVPLIMTQSTRDLALKSSTGTLPLNGLLTLKAGHFAGVEALDQAEGTAIVDELLSVRVSLPLGTMVFTVQHFSGYMVAW